MRKCSTRFSILFLLLLGLVFGHAQVPALELAPGAGNPTDDGPVTTTTLTFQNNSDNPTGNTFEAYTPETTVTLQLSNQQYTLPADHSDWPDGGSVVFGYDIPGSRPIFDALSNHGTPSDSWFTSYGASPGAGLSTAENYGVRFMAMTLPFKEAELPTDGKYHVADLTITFNRPLDNPILHIAGMGGGVRIGDNSRLGFTIELELLSSNVSLERLSGSNAFAVENGTIKNLGDGRFDSSGTDRSGTGSVELTGEGVTSVSFKMYIRGDGYRENPVSWSRYPELDGNDVPYNDGDAFTMSFSAQAFKPSIELVKENEFVKHSDGKVAVAGVDEIHYTFTATNTSGIKLTNVVITDPMFDASDLVYTWPGPVGVLEPDESVIATAVYTLEEKDLITGIIDNEAIVTGEDEAGNEVDDKDNTRTQVPVGSGPNCSNFAPAIDGDGDIEFGLSDLLTNAGTISDFPVTIKVYNSWGVVIEEFTISDPDETLQWNVCNLMGQKLEFSVTNPRGTCEKGEMDLSDILSLDLNSAWKTQLDSEGDTIVSNISDGKINVYCGQIPDPSDHIPTVTDQCNNTNYVPTTQPDWHMPVSCDEVSDTADLIYRTWEVIDRAGNVFTLVDTIVVFRLPKLTDQSFLGRKTDSVFCSLHEVVNKGSNDITYNAWKQPTGIHDYELPYSKLGAFVYDLPVEIVEMGERAARECGRLDAYYDQVIMITAAGEEITIGYILSGDYFADYWTGLSGEQEAYLILHGIYDGASLTNYYLFPQIGDQLLSEDGHFETVTNEWFYNGHGQAPFWFSGGWPFVCGEGDCTSYCDGSSGIEEKCIEILVPRLTIVGGMISDECDTICLNETDKTCGFFLDRDEMTTTGDCPFYTGGHFTITQTCWAETESPCEGDSDLVTDWDEYDNDGNGSIDKQVLTLYQKTYFFDTLPPIFNFCYIGDEEVQAGVKDSISSGLQPDQALEWERNNATVYTVSSRECTAEIFAPDVELIDNCSGIHQVKAIVAVPGGNRMVELEETTTDTLPNGCVVRTFSHLNNPIKLPFSGCDGELIEVKYEAADGCWNQSEWKKFLTIRDETVPVANTDRNINVKVSDGSACVPADRYDEGSWDNCSIELMLARRSDWIDAYIDVCEKIEEQPENWAAIFDIVGLNADGSVDVQKLQNLLTGSAVGDYYAGQVEKLNYNFGTNGQKVLHGWIYDIARYIATNCSKADGLGNTINPQSLNQEIDRVFEIGYGNELSYLGGGWVECVPFECKDACEVIPSELLVMDQCGNWNTNWSDTHVEDDSQADEISSLEDLSISCEAYNMFYKDIVDAAAAFNGNDGSDAEGAAEAYAQLDSVFGTYVLAQFDNQRRPVDVEAGDLVFSYNNISCYEESETVKIDKTDHDGNLYQESQVVKTTQLDTTVFEGENGLYRINCSGTVRQEILVNLDVCGQGEIIRRFFISGGCVDEGSVTEVSQTITVESACPMRESMFDVPSQVGSANSPICLPRALSKDFMPDTIGELAVKAHLEGRLCNSIATGFTVTERDMSGYPGLKQFEITWSAVDWCCAKDSPDREYFFRQKVMATIDPDCNVDMADPNEGSSLVEGNIATQSGTMIRDVEMKAVLGSGSPMTTMTGVDGRYNFNVNNGWQVSLIPNKNNDFAVGVTTQDLIEIQRYLTNKGSLDLPYQRIAADVNGNGEVDVFDIIELRKLILRPDSYKFVNNTSWRFFDKIDGKEVYDLKKVNGDVTVDWIGVKIGDVDMSGESSDYQRSTAGTLRLTVAGSDGQLTGLKAGETYRLDVTSDNFDDITGMQFTLSYLNDKVEVETIEAGALNMTADHYYRYAPGVITSSWHDADGLTLRSDEVLFTLVLRAKSDIAVRDLFSLNNRVTRTEAYDGADQLKNISLRFDEDRNGFALYQNSPNPYFDQTTIGFRLPEATKATISVYDVTGKMLKVIEGDYDAGYNEVKLQAGDLRVNGVLYYQLDTKEYTATRKMVVIE